MTIQTTFRSVAKPKVKVLSSALAGGQLILDQATIFVLSDAAVGSITSLLGHQYLIDGQEIVISNAHLTSPISISIGSFSKVIPAGYGAVLYYDAANSSFYAHKKHADLKPLEDNIAANALAISTETSDRIADTDTLFKLDGSRALTGNVNVNNKFLNNVPAAINGDQAVQKAQLDAIVAAIYSSISSSATSLQWRSKVNFITKFTSGSIPANGSTLLDSSYGAGDLRLFEDDQGPDYATVANIPVGSNIVFLKAGEEPKLMIVRDIVGTKKYYDETEVDINLKVSRAVTAGDTFIVGKDLLGSPEDKETQAIYHIEDGAPKTALKLGDLDWETATSIVITNDYLAGPGGQTIVSGDSVQTGLQKLDGNIEKNKTDTATDLSDAIALEVTNRNSAIATSIAQEVLDRDSAILTSQNSQEAMYASNNGASLIGIHDTNNLYLALTVEEALKEAREHIDIAELDINNAEATIISHTATLAQHTSDLSDLFALDLAHKADLSSASFGNGASLISVHDAGDRFTAVSLEDVLVEVDTKVEALNLVNLKRGLHEAMSTGATSLNLTADFVDQLTGGTVQDLSSATYMNALVNRDGAMLIGGVGYTIAGSVLTLTANGGGQLLAGEVVEVRIINITKLS
jgi:hypothetical protein